MMSQNLKELRSIIDDVSIGVVIQGPKTEIIACNPAALEMLGLTEEALLKRSSYNADWDIIREDGTPLKGLEHPVPQAIKTRKAIRDVVMGVYRPLKQDRVWIMVSAVPQLNERGRVDRVICSFTDITARKQAEAALERMNHELEQRVQERTAQLVEINAQLSASEARLKLLTDNASDLICLHEPDGHYIYVTPSCLPMLGYTQAEMIGKNPYTYFHPADIAAIEISHDNSLSGHITESVEYRFRKKDGSYIWLETRTEPIITNGVVEKLVTVSRNCTERRRIQEELKQERDLLARIMETNPAGIVVVEANGQITFGNPRAEEILGLKKTDFTARSYAATEWKSTDYDGAPWPDEKQPFVLVMQTKKPVNDIRHAIEWPDGRRVYLSINGAPLFDENGEIAKVVFSIENYTQRKYWQDEIEQALASEKKLNEMKTNFISTVSHEFRTPIAVIMTSTDILRMHFDRFSKQQMIARLDKIADQVWRLTSLLEDVTFLNKSDMMLHNLKPVWIDLRAFLEHLIDEIRMVYGSQIHIVMEGNPITEGIWLDETMFHQIVTNLLSNAVKYSNPGGKVILRYDYRGDSLTLQIIDAGIGIPEADQSHLFELFHRASNVGIISGTGMGLVIIKRAVERLGGDITVKSAENVGTTITVQIPLVSGK